MKGRLVNVIVLAVALAGAAGCEMSKPPLEERLASGDPKLRGSAAVDLVTSERADATVRLIHLLADPDEGVRFFAGAALRRRTGQSFGFQAQGPLRERAEAIQHWIDWYVAAHPGSDEQFADLAPVLALLDGSAEASSTVRGAEQTASPASPGEATD